MKKAGVFVLLILISGAAKARAQSYEFHPSEYQVVSVREARPDGTLILRGGHTVKVPRDALDSGVLRRQKNLLIFSEGGAFHVDSEGSIVGSVLILPEPDSQKDVNVPFERR
ncbi:MAG TPA: hypothetical protein PKL97_05215 [Candidatus Omnitrophota bacterium]|nr:hypothetical protein [Candidatus Omnitrophota bacterium]